MKKDEARGEEYVLQVRENTQKYIEALIEENERLRSLVNDLEEQRRQTDRQLGIAESELGRIESERQKLAERIDQIEVESQDLLGQFQEIERQNSDLASLYVASYRLHETIKRSEVIAVIEEIVVNMIGSEELAIFELDHESGKVETRRFPRHRSEADLERVRLNESRIEEATGVLQEVVETGQRYVVDSGDGKAPGEEFGAHRLRSPDSRRPCQSARLRFSDCWTRRRASWLPSTSSSSIYSQPTRLPRSIARIECRQNRRSTRDYRSGSAARRQLTGSVDRFHHARSITSIGAGLSLPPETVKAPTIEISEFLSGQLRASRYVYRRVAIKAMVDDFRRSRRPHLVSKRRPVRLRS